MISKELRAATFIFAQQFVLQLRAKRVCCIRLLCLYDELQETTIILSNRMCEVFGSMSGHRDAFI